MTLYSDTSPRNSALASCYEFRMTRAAEILEAALQLSDAEREQLVEALAVSLYGKDLGEEWEVEIQDRVSDLDAGRVAAVPGQAVFKRLEQRLGGR